MQCKSIELLEVLLEETNERSDQIIKAVSKDLKKGNIIKFIKEMYTIKKSVRSMFRAYHILRSLADKGFIEFG